MTDRGAVHSSGFTLLELLISIVLLSTILVVVSGALRLAYRSTGTGERKIAHLERFRSSLSIIGAQMESAVPLSYTDEHRAKRLYFRGTEHALRLVTGYSIARGHRGYVIVEYRAVMNDAGTWSLNASEARVGTSQSKETTLLRELSTVRFDYFVKDATDETGKWIAAWDDPVKLPRKVRITLGAGGNTFSLIFPVKVQKLLVRTTVSAARLYAWLQQSGTTPMTGGVCVL